VTYRKLGCLTGGGSYGTAQESPSGKEPDAQVNYVQEALMFRSVGDDRDGRGGYRA
jgi:hypothetical protein